MKHVRSAVVAGLVLAAGLTFVWTPSASAQQSITVRATSPFGGGGASQITRRSLERYAEVLGLTADQKEAAMAIHEGYTASYDQARKARRDAMEDLRRTAEDSDDRSVFMEKMPRIEKDWREQTTRLDQSLLADLRAMLNSSQENSWPAVERMRRRETTLRGGTLSGEAVDLVDAVHNLKVPSEIAATLTPVLDEYEASLDRMLVEKESRAKDAPAFEPGKPLDLDAMRKAMDDARESGKKIVALNEQTARKIEAMLPESQRGAFRDDVLRRSFPRVYRPTKASRDLEAALGMTDLDASQREALAGLRETFEREQASANAAWAKAIRDSEESGQQGGMAGMGGGRMMMSFGDEPEALKDARKARREVDDRAAERLRSILRPEQRERLPKAPPPGEEGGDGPGGEAVMMIRSEERSGHR
jgi:hypothetical protein